MPLTPEQQKEIESIFAASFARNEALEAARRKQAGEVVLCLGGGPDDAPVQDRAFQEELRTFSAALHASGAKVSQRAFAMDAVDGGGYALPEFVIDVLKVATAPVAALCGAWLQARFGRKVRLKIGDVEAEGRSTKEIEELLERAQAFQKDTRGNGGKE